jgi:hypothetical protein
MAWVFQGRQAVFGLGDLPWRRLAHVSQELGFKATAVEISASQKESLRSHWNMVRHFYGFRTFEQEGGFIINQDIDVMVRSRFQPKRVPVRHQDPGLRKVEVSG